MTDDETRPDDEQGLDPADERAVSDLLASVGQDTPPMPADVASRLDDVLVDLAAERDRPAKAAREPAVTELEQRRTERLRRRWPQVLVAAAAVSVVGLGIGSLLDDLGSGSGDSLTAGSAAERQEADAPADGGTADQGAGGAESGGKPVVPKSGVVSGRLAEPQRLRSGSLPADAQRLADYALTSATALDSGVGRSAIAQCESPETEQGDDLYAVLLDREPATIVFRGAEDGVRQADVYACDDAGEPVATTFVSVR